VFENPIITGFNFTRFSYLMLQVKDFPGRSVKFISHYVIEGLLRDDRCFCTPNLWGGGIGLEVLGVQHFEK